MLHDSYDIRHIDNSVNIDSLMVIGGGLEVLVLWDERNGKMYTANRTIDGSYLIDEHITEEVD